MRTSGRWEDPPEPLRLGRGRSWVPSPRPASEVPQVCRPAPRPQRPERTWDDQGTLSRPPTLFRPPRPSSPEKCDPAPGQAASEAGAPGLLPGWPPARPGPAGPRVWVLRAPQVARDAPGESGNRSPRGGGGAPWARPDGRAARAAGPPGPPGPGAAPRGRPAPPRAALHLQEARPALRASSGLCEKPVCRQWVLESDPSTPRPLQMQVCRKNGFIPGLGAVTGVGCRPGEWSMKNGQPSFFLVFLKQKTEVPSYNLARRSCRPGAG